MQKINSLEYNKKILLLDSTQEDFRRRIYIEKSFNKDKGKDQYFFKAYTLDKYGSLECIGYIYFYLDKETKSSMYIGTYVDKRFRNSKIGSLLTSFWINYCLDNGIYNLYTSNGQRKPFLIYLLKRFEFELNDIDEYKKSRYNIHICRKMLDPEKYLLFDCQGQKESFIKGKIYKADNYRVIDSLDSDMVKLDTVILSTPYALQNPESAYQKSLRIIDRYR